MTKYFIHFFHVVIIASLTLSLGGCGYKADPSYTPSEKEAAK